MVVHRREGGLGIGAVELVEVHVQGVRPRRVLVHRDLGEPGDPRGGDVADVHVIAPVVEAAGVLGAPRADPHDQQPPRRRAGEDALARPSMAPKTVGLVRAGHRCGHGEAVVGLDDEEDPAVGDAHRQVGSPERGVLPPGGADGARFARKPAGAVCAVARVDVAKFEIEQCAGVVLHGQLTVAGSAPRGKRVPVTSFCPYTRTRRPCRSLYMRGRSNCHTGCSPRVYTRRKDPRGAEYGRNEPPRLREYPWKTSPPEPE